ncbi:MAG TPA: FAD binding domain-containing protein [Acidobacteriota bacterium]|nr:FAD binding domain-containing protein [Acidobacteriota bacterium]
MRRFAYRNTTTVAEAVLLLKGGHAAVLAGGTDIINLLRMGALTSPPETLVNIKNIPGMDFIREDANGLNIGATAKLSDIASSEIIKSKYSALARAAESVGSPPIREMGTIAGNLCQHVQCWYFRRSFLTGNFFDCLRKGGSQCYAVAGDNRYHAILGAKQCFAVCPSDTAVALVALDSEIITNKRSIPIAGFFQVQGNVLDEDEIIIEIRVPAPKPDTKQVFIKFALRPTIDFAVASVAAVITTELGKVSDARIVLGAVAPVPYRANGAENALKGNAVSEWIAEAAAAAAVNKAVPLSNNKYKVQIIRTLVKRAILES